VCVREVEADTLVGKPIEAGRKRGTAVHAQRIGSERIDRDEEDILSGYRMEIRLRAAAAEQPEGSDD
jgi:hypothetical protein